MIQDIDFPEKKFNLLVNKSKFLENKIFADANEGNEDKNNSRREESSSENDSLDSKYKQLFRYDEDKHCESSKLKSSFSKNNLTTDRKITIRHIE